MLLLDENMDTDRFTNKKDLKQGVAPAVGGRKNESNHAILSEIAEEEDISTISENVAGAVKSTSSNLISGKPSEAGIRRQSQQSQNGVRLTKFNSKLSIQSTD